MGCKDTPLLSESISISLIDNEQNKWDIGTDQTNAVISGEFS